MRRDARDHASEDKQRASILDTAAEISKYYRDTAAGGVGLSEALRGVDAPLIKPERLQELEKELGRLQGTLVRAQAAMQSVRVGAREAGDEAAGAGPDFDRLNDAVGNLNASLGETRDLAKELDLKKLAPHEVALEIERIARAQRDAIADRLEDADDMRRTLDDIHAAMSWWAGLHPIPARSTRPPSYRAALRWA